MGQKVNPIGFRIGNGVEWKSSWYASKKQYREQLVQDLKARNIIFSSFPNAQISDIKIERYSERAIILLFTARPGMVVGKKGADIEVLKTKLSKLFNYKVDINVKEVRRPETNARLIASSISSQIEKRSSFRKVMKKAIQSAVRYGAVGIKIRCSGRLGGDEIARAEWYKKGRIPLHTIRADIDYATMEANTAYGVIGIKVWVYKGPFKANR